MSGMEFAALAALAGSAVSAVGTIASGRAAAEIGKAEQGRLQASGVVAKQAADYEAAQLDIQAKEERAAGQQEMLQLRRQKNLALSKLQATAAGSGFSATDPSSLAIADEIEKYGTLQEQTALYGGGSRATGLRAAAAGRRFSGESALSSAYASGEIARATGRAKRNAGYFDAAGTILGGIGSFDKKYARQQPKEPVGRYG